MCYTCIWEQINNIILSVQQLSNSLLTLITNGPWNKLNDKLKERIFPSNWLHFELSNEHSFSLIACFFLKNNTKSILILFKIIVTNLFQYQLFIRLSVKYYLLLKFLVNKSKFCKKKIRKFLEHLDLKTIFNYSKMLLRYFRKCLSKRNCNQIHC